jgi:hypothetical protein
MKRGAARAALVSALAAWVVLPGCGRVAGDVLWSVDAGAPREAGASGVDGSVGGEAGSDAGTGADADLDGGVAAVGMDAAANDGDDGSQCATFQPTSIWTPTSESFDFDIGSEDMYETSNYQFSESNRTLYGDACIGSPSLSRWLVHLTEEQVDAIVAQVTAVQTVSLCEFLTVFSNTWGAQMCVSSADPSLAAVCYSVVSYVSIPPPPYMSYTESAALLNLMSALIVGACDPDAGGGNPAVCVPVDQDGGALDAGGGD